MGEKEKERDGLRREGGRNGKKLEEEWLYQWNWSWQVDAPAISNFAVSVAVAGVKMVAFCLKGTKPTFATSISYWSVHTPRVVKKPLTFVCARILYGVIASDMFASDSGTSVCVKTRPVRTWFSHVHASQASFSTPTVQFFEQSRENRYQYNVKTECLFNYTMCFWGD